MDKSLALVKKITDGIPLTKAMSELNITPNHLIGMLADDNNAEILNMALLGSTNLLVTECRSLALAKLLEILTEGESIPSRKVLIHTDEDGIVLKTVSETTITKMPLLPYIRLALSMESAPLSAVKAPADDKDQLTAKIRNILNN